MSCKDIHMDAKRALHNNIMLDLHDSQKLGDPQCAYLMDRFLGLLRIKRKIGMTGNIQDELYK